MKIHVGYDLVYECVQPTPMIFMFNVHPSRAADLLTADRIRVTKPRIGRILIARGRDAADVAIGTTFGANILKRFVVRTEEVTSEDEPAVRFARAAEADR